VTRQPRLTCAAPADLCSPEPPGGILARALDAATAAAAPARATAAADTAAGGCAHHRASPGYRPPPRLRDHVTARDLTCRSPVCRQPAWRGDLDHTIPHDNGGITCSCNLGGGCLLAHRLCERPPKTAPPRARCPPAGAQDSWQDRPQRTPVR
jgi:hypothetical protein